MRGENGGGEEGLVKTLASFGPDRGVPGSALWRMASVAADDGAGASGPPLILLSPGTEILGAGIELRHGIGDEATAPEEVIIDGGGRVLRGLGGPGPLIMLEGVSLTLRNIILAGSPGHEGPLVVVGFGGTLILGKGAVLEDNLNRNAAEGQAGGVYVDLGGSLVMGEGSVIRNNTVAAACSGGGVCVAEGGGFVMEGGAITCNTAGGKDSGGGVYAAGIFEMTGGHLYGNTAGAECSGGGVCVAEGGDFTMKAGVISSNLARGKDSGGGVYVGGINYGDVWMDMEDDENLEDEVWVRAGSFDAGVWASVISNNATNKGSWGGVYIAQEGILSLPSSPGSITGNIGPEPRYDDYPQFAESGVVGSA
jgi:hypothetical protein